MTLYLPVPGHGWLDVAQPVPQVLHILCLIECILISAEVQGAQSATERTALIPAEHVLSHPVTLNGAE